MNENCTRNGQRNPLPKDVGLPELVDVTCDNLDTRVRTAFIGQQAIDIRKKDLYAADIIKKATRGARVGLFRKKLEKKIAVMIVDLATLWTFPRTSKGVTASWSMFPGLTRLWASLTQFFNTDGVKTCVASTGAGFYRIMRALANITSNQVAAEYQSLTSTAYFQRNPSSCSGASIKDSNESDKLQVVTHLVENFIYVLQVQYTDCYRNMHPTLDNLPDMLRGWEPLTERHIALLKAMES